MITSQIHGIEQNGDNANPLVKVLYAYDKAKGTGSVIVYLKNTTEKTSADFAYAYPRWHWAKNTAPRSKWWMVLPMLPSIPMTTNL